MTGVNVTAQGAEGHFWEYCLAIWYRLFEPIQSTLCLHWGLPLPVLGADGRVLNATLWDGLGKGRGRGG